MKTLFDTETTPVIRDSYVFYRSFFDAIKKLSTKERLAAYNLDSSPENSAGNDNLVCLPKEL